jgi:diacylglycerol kinase family enzyme
MINSVKHDVGLVEYIDIDGNIKKKYFLNNASIGITAKANYLFNNGDWIINYFKNKCITFTISYTSLKTLFVFTPIEVILNYNGQKKSLKINNLNIIKNTFVSGGFRYDQDIRCDDQRLGVNYIYNANIFELLKGLFDLCHEKFISTNSKKRISTYADTIKITSENYIHLETDGEVTLAKDILFTLYTQKINICGHGWD